MKSIIISIAFCLFSVNSFGNSECSCGSLQQGNIYFYSVTGDDCCNSPVTSADAVSISYKQQKNGTYQQVGSSFESNVGVQNFCCGREN